MYSNKKYISIYPSNMTLGAGAIHIFEVKIYNRTASDGLDGVQGSIDACVTDAVKNIPTLTAVLNQSSRA